MKIYLSIISTGDVMTNKYYDSWEFKKALSHTTSDSYEAIAKFEEYIKKYPEDYFGYIYYSANLVTVGRLEEAKKVLDYLETAVNKDYKFIHKEENKMNDIKRSIIFIRLRILSYEEKYEELYEILQKDKGLVAEFDIGDLSFYCRKKLGMLDSNRREINGYLFRQIIEYKESDFLEHIKKHLADYNKDLDEPNKNIFVPDFPVLQVIEEIKKYIPSDKRICAGFWDNIYFFRYDNCGRDKNKMVNYFKVICLNNSSDFITMCPVAGCENLPYVDLNYMVDNDRSSKVKKVSAIEKFNRKHRRN